MQSKLLEAAKGIRLFNFPSKIDIQDWIWITNHRISNAMPLTEAIDSIGDGKQRLAPWIEM